MQRALRRAGWAQAAAVGLGLVLPTGSLPAANPVPPSSERVAPKPEAAAIHAAAAEDQRVTEIAIELAWLADPATFPYHLAARIEGSNLHARGYVQNKAARDRVLQLAREHCTLEVIDDLKIHASMVIGAMAPQAVPTPADAEAALQEAFPNQTVPFRVTCRPSGQISVTGTVATLEEKLVVSQRLRQLPGCAAVVNELHVGQAPATAATLRPDAGHEHKMPAGPTHPERTGETWIPAAHLQQENSAAPAPLQPAPPPTEETSAPPDPLVPTASRMGSVQQPAPMPLGPSEYPVPSTPAPGAAPAPHSENPGLLPASNQTGPSPTAGKTALVPNAPLLARLKMRVENVCGSGALDVHLVPQSGRNLLVQFKVRDDAQAARLAEQVLAMPELANYHVDLDVSVADSPAVPVPSVSRPAVEKTGPTAVMAPTAAPSPPTELSPAIPPVPEFHKAAPPPAVSTWMPTDGTPKTIKIDPVSVSNVKSNEGSSYTLPEIRTTEAQTVRTPATPPSPATPAKLKGYIESACGSGVRNLRVAVQSPGRVLVEFTAPNETEGERLAAKVMTLPELSAYHVDLDVKVADALASATPPAAVSSPKGTGKPAAVAVSTASTKPAMPRASSPPVPPPPVVPVSWNPMPLPIARPAPAAATKADEGPSVGTGTITINAPASVARPPVVVTASAPKPSSEVGNGSGAYETTGVIVISEPARMAPRAEILYLQERVASVCGSGAQVNLVARSATNLLVQLKAHDAGEGERLTAAILGLPELRPYRVDVDVKLGQ